MSRRILKIFVGLATFMMLASSPLILSSAKAQVAGANLSGTVTDASGGAVPNAQVSIQNRATDVTRQVTTDSAGFYSAPNLPPGGYNVTAKAEGFATHQQIGITLTVGASESLNLTLQVEGSSQKVEVTAEAPTVELTSSSIAGVVNETTVRELPLNGRDWTQLAALQPGVASIRGQRSTGGTSNRGNRGFGNQLTDSGHRPSENNYRLDGVSINDYSNSGPGSVLGVNLGADAIQEFSVVVANSTAEYGRASGAVINAVTKSGTNDFHGDVYEFLRNSALDAKNFFDSPTNSIPPFRRNQFGASRGRTDQEREDFHLR